MEKKIIEFYMKMINKRNYYVAKLFVLVVPLFLAVSGNDAFAYNDFAVKAVATEKGGYYQSSTFYQRTIPHQKNRYFRYPLDNDVFYKPVTSVVNQVTTMTSEGDNLTEPFYPLYFK